MHALSRLIFTSVMSPALDADSLKHLIKSARGNNFALSLTSILVRNGSHFLQVMEGSPDTVDELFVRIARDRRHSGVSMMASEPTEQRLFGEWPMGYVELSAQQVATLSGATNAGLPELSIGELNVGRAKHLLTELAKSTTHREPSPAAAA